MFHMILRINICFITLKYLRDKILLYAGNETSDHIHMKFVLKIVTDWLTTINFPQCNSPSSSLSSLQGLRPRGPFRSQFRNPEAPIMAFLCSFFLQVYIS